VVFCTLLFLSSVAARTAGSLAPSSGVFGKCWEYRSSPNLGTGIAADTSSVYFLDDENKLTGIDLVTGTKTGASDPGGSVASNLLVLNDSILFVTNSQSDASTLPIKSMIQSLSRKTGVTEWSAGIISSSKVWLGSMTGVVVAVGSDGAVAAISSADGKAIWRTDLKSSVSAAPYFRENGIEIATSSGEVVRVAGGDGRVHVRWKVEYLPTAVLVDLRGRLVIGDDRGNLVSVSSNGDEIWSFRNGAQISSAALYGSYYLAASYDNFVYKLSRSGDVKWKRRLSGRVNDGPLVLGDTALISIVGSGSVYLLDLKNGKISNRIDSGGDEVSLRVTTSPDGLGFAIAGPSGISYFSIKCPVK
jgi:outer membrane protein assembly factor BamB